MADRESFGVTIVKTVEDMFEEVFDEFAETFSSKRRLASSSYRVLKSLNLVTVEIDVPGASSKDVKVRCSPGAVSIEWTPKGREKREKELRIGRAADISAITAKVEHGVLTIQIPSKVPEGDEREVAVG